MYKCKKCSITVIKWSGQCNGCKNWNTLEEFVEKKEVKNLVIGKTQKLSKIENDKVEDKFLTKSEEFNNVLGGGIVKGSLILMTGEPGIGKSTITLQISSWLENNSIIYVSGEETTSQIASRANRLGVTGNNLSILSQTNLEDILETLKQNPCDLVIIDSISVLHSNNISGSSGSINQVKYITESLMDFSKKTNTSIILIGHVTKDGNLAGPKALEHLVDTVLFFEGNKFDSIRILRSIKNRFGATSEIGIFNMLEDGITDLKNPGLEFINSGDKTPINGSAISITMEGTRPIIVEGESLTTYTKFGYPKRSSRGVASSKIDMILAIIGKYTQVKLENSDVYFNIARGIKIEEPGIDLAIAASVISSKLNKKISRDCVFVGEMSLTGKIKKVFSIEKRVKEAEKMGFESIFIPNIEIKQKYKINLIKINTISDLIKNLV